VAHLEGKLASGVEPVNSLQEAQEKMLFCGGQGKARTRERLDSTGQLCSRTQGAGTAPPRQTRRETGRATLLKGCH